MIRIAFIGDAQNPHFPKWLSALCEQGISIDFMSYVPPLEPIKGVTFHKIDLPFGQRHGWYNFHLAPILPFVRLLNQLKPDLLIGSFGTNYGWLALRTGFKPFILQTWTRDLTIAPFEGFKRFFYRPVMEKALLYADLVITDGEALAKIGQERFPQFKDKIKPIRWGIRLADFQSNPEKRKQARAQWQIPDSAPVLTNGRGIYEWYNPELTLPALKSVLERDEKTYAIILTNAHERSAEVQGYLDQLAQHPRARVVDERLPVHEVSKIWAISDGVISIPKFDGISEALLEAMYAGAIPIVNDIPSNRSFLEHGKSGYFVPTTTAEALSQSLSDFILNLSQLRTDIVPNNQKFVETEASVEGSALLLKKHIQNLT